MYSVLSSSSESLFGRTLTSHLAYDIQVFIIYWLDCLLSIREKTPPPMKLKIWLISIGAVVSALLIMLAAWLYFGRNRQQGPLPDTSPPTIRLQCDKAEYEAGEPIVCKGQVTTNRPGERPVFLTLAVKQGKVNFYSAHAIWDEAIDDLNHPFHLQISSSTLSGAFDISASSVTTIWLPSQTGDKSPEPQPVRAASKTVKIRIKKGKKK